MFSIEGLFEFFWSPGAECWWEGGFLVLWSFLACLLALSVYSTLFVLFASAFNTLCLFTYEKKKSILMGSCYIYIYIYESRAQGNPAGHMSSAASPDSFKMESQSSMNMEMEPLKGQIQ